MTRCRFKMAAIWKPVPSYPGMLASDEGEILLPPRHAPLRNGGYRIYTPKPSRGVQARASVGAQHVYLSYWTRAYGNVKVHRAICEAFHGPAPFDGAVVMHLDENALNNRPDNLKWGTQKENLSAPGFRRYLASPERAAKLRRAS